VLCIDKEMLLLSKSCLSLLSLASHGGINTPYIDRTVMAYPDGNANKPIACDATQKDLVPFRRPGFFAKDIRVMSDGLH
jgi:hypothetical protein